MKLMASVAGSIVVWMLASCRSGWEGANPNLRMHFPSIDVSGKYASSLTIDDVRQIRDLSRSRKDINLRISFIKVDTSGCAEIKTEDSRVVHYEFFYFTFTVCKKNGIWAIDSRSIKKQLGTVSSPEDEPVILD